jgi:hypothetical protein
MPRAHEYRDAAIHLRRVDARLAYEWTLVRIATAPDRIAAGPLGALVEERLEAADARIGRTRLELARLAAVCDRRADICTRFTADVQRHRRLAETLGAWAPPPAAPAWWVEP